MANMFLLLKTHCYIRFICHVMPLVLHKDEHVECSHVHHIVRNVGSSYCLFLQDETKNVESSSKAFDECMHLQ